MKNMGIFIEYVYGRTTEVANKPKITKIVLTGDDKLVVKFEDDNVICYDFSNARSSIIYRSNSNANKIIDRLRYHRNFPDHFTVELNNIKGDTSVRRELRRIFDEIVNYPVFIWGATGEDESTDITPTETIFFPPPETHVEWLERIAARLLHLSRRVSVLRHEQPHLSSRSRRVCLDLDDRNEYVHRYDHSINLMRLPVGKLQLDINAYNQRWDAHQRKVIEAENADNPIPKFTRLSDRDDIEALLVKLETNLTEETLIEHHETHNTTEWGNAHSERLVVLCNEDCSVGEVLLDINSFHTDRDGNTNHQLAEQSFHDIAVKHWNEVQRTTFRKIVTERIIA